MSTSNRIPPSVVKGCCSTVKSVSFGVTNTQNTRGFRLTSSVSGSSTSRLEKGSSLSSRVTTSSDKTRTPSLYRSLSNLFWHRKKAVPPQRQSAVDEVSEGFRRIPIIPNQPIVEDPVPTTSSDPSSKQSGGKITNQSDLRTEGSLKRSSTFVVGLEGDSHGYLALHKAFELCNAHDKILGVHIPVEKLERIYEVIPDLGDLIPQMSPVDPSREQFMDLMRNRARLISSDYAEKQVHFEMLIGEDSVNVKEDLIRACREFGSDYLVIGHSMMPHNDDGFFDRVIGHISDYCVDKSPCTVVVVKGDHSEGDLLLQRLSQRMEVERKRKAEVEKEQLIQDESDPHKTGGIPSDHP